MKSSAILAAVGAACAVGAVVPGLYAAPQGKGSGKSPVKPAAAVKPRQADSAATPAAIAKPLTADVKRGLAWLAKQQQKGGGWSQGDESQQMGRGGGEQVNTPNVADTCASTLALMRSGSTPAKGEYAENIRRGLTFVCEAVETAPAQGLSITKMQGTRLQGKLGPYIDTFLASLVLAEARGKMPDAKSEKRLRTALDRVMDKIEKNQKSDGTFTGEGWAPVLSQAVAAKAINRSYQNGAKVSEGVRSRTETYARGQFGAAGAGAGGFGAAGSAGVPLYSAAGNLGAIQDSDNSNGKLEQEARKTLKESKDEKAKAKAKSTLKRVEDNRRDLQQARASVVKQLDDKQFMAGFGSNGGEECLSYMNIGESLVVKGGPEWEK